MLYVKYFLFPPKAAYLWWLNAVGDMQYPLPCLKVAGLHLAGQKTSHGSGIAQRSRRDTLPQPPPVTDLPL